MAITNEKSPIQKLSILSLEGITKKNQLNYQMLFLLHGSVRIQSSSITYFLDDKDVILLYPRECYTISGRGNTLLLMVELDSNFISKSQPLQEGSYICNSSLDKERDYAPLRNLLSQIAIMYFSKEEYAFLNLTSLAYQLLYYLNSYHYEKAAHQEPKSNHPKYQERVNTILNYIHLNYASDITLQALADYVHLTTPYLSKFFKNQLHSNFNYYVNQIRLAHAMEDLCNSNKSVTTIAHNNGFPSMNAFNKLFKEKYKTTPSKFRNQLSSPVLSASYEEEGALIEMDYDTHKQLLEEYSANSSDILPKFDFPYQKNINIPDVHTFQEMKPIWRSMINLGSTLHIAKRDLNKQLIQMQNDIPFQYGRIEAVLNDRFLPKDPVTGCYSFTSFDRAIDLLQTNHLIPYLDLTLPYEVMAAPSRDIILVDTSEYLEMVNAILVHSANNFGVEEVEKWVFEIGYYENHITKQHEAPEDFADRFCLAFQAIKRLLPEALVGGISYHLSLPPTRLKEILQCLSNRKLSPDFISLTIFPYEIGDTEDISQSERSAFFYSSDVSFAKHKVMEFKKLLAGYQNLSPLLFVNALGADIRRQYFLNDTCFQATFFIKNTIDLLGEVDLLGYYQLSDTAYTQAESNQFLNGHNGIMNQFGIKKPGWLALQILNHSGSNLIDKGPNYMITKGRREIYHITLCNYIHISDYYCLNTQEELSIQDAYSVYSEPKTQKISIRLGNMLDGIYHVITYRINKNSGSLLDEWSRIGFWEEATRREFDYFKSIIQPKRNYQHMTCTEGTLEFDIQLAPHEVVFLEISLEL